MSSRNAAQTWPTPRGIDRVDPFSHAPVPMLSYVAGWIDMSRVEREPVGGRVDCLNRVELGARRGAGEVDEPAGGEEHAAVRRDVHGRVRAEHLQPAIALVQVHVRDGVVRASVHARDGDVVDVRARDAELRRVRVDVRERDADLLVADPRVGGHGARNERERHER